MGKDRYMCQLCQNHGIFDVPKKGHKQLCPYKNCDCSSCILNAKRRELDQIERQLKKDDTTDSRNLKPGLDVNSGIVAVADPNIIPQLHSGPTCFSVKERGMGSFGGEMLFNPLQHHLIRSPTSLSDTSAFSNGHLNQGPHISRHQHAMLPIVPAAGDARGRNICSKVAGCPRYSPYECIQAQGHSKFLFSKDKFEQGLTNEQNTVRDISQLQQGDSRGAEMSKSSNGSMVVSSGKAVKQHNNGQPSIFRSAELMAKPEH